MTKIHKQIIIGGGPAGLSAAVYTSRAGLKPTVLAGSPPGGQLMLTTEVENFPGVAQIMGPDLIEELRKQASLFGTEIINENVTSVHFDARPFTISYSNSQIKAESIIIATGAKALWLELESEQLLRGRGVSACATCDGFFFKDKIVAVVGGGDTAMEETQTLSRFAKKIFVIHRKDSFRASKIMQDKILSNPKVEVMWDTTVEEVLGKDKVEGLKVKTSGKDPKEVELRIDGLFLAIGHRPDTALFRDKIILDEKGYIITSAVLALFKFQNPDSKIQTNTFNPIFQTMTSVEGVFAAGDCVDHVYRQAGTASGMGISAALDSVRWLERLNQ